MSLEPITVGELLPEATLADCERLFREGERQEKFGQLKQAVALRAIRDESLFSPSHDSFKSYVEDHLGYTEQWAYGRIALAQVAGELNHGLATPAIINERQARAIKPVLRDHGPEVATEVLREAADDSGKITARSITEATARVIVPEVVDTIPGEDYRNALDRYPELDVPGAEAGEVVEIASMIDARPEHERDMRVDAGAKWLAAKAAGRLSQPAPADPTEPGQRIYQAAFALLKVTDRDGQALAEAFLSADPMTRSIWERTLIRLAEVTSDLAASIPASTLRSVK
jgi:hypothetical protein